MNLANQVKQVNQENQLNLGESGETGESGESGELGETDDQVTVGRCFHTSTCKLLLWPIRNKNVRRCVKESESQPQLHFQRIRLEV